MSREIQVRAQGNIPKTYSIRNLQEPLRSEAMS